MRKIGITQEEQGTSLASRGHEQRARDLLFLWESEMRNISDYYRRNTDS